MKSIKNKKSSNSSFLSNHDLLQNFRNKSFKFITRQNSLSQLKSIPKKVGLIQKKSYSNILTQNKQNDPNIANKKKSVNNTTNNTQRQKTDKQQNLQTSVYKVIKQLNFVYDQINQQQIQIRMILNKNIRKIKELFATKTLNTEQQSTQLTSNKLSQTKQKQLKDKIQSLQLKNQEQYKKIYLYKREKQDLQQERIQIYQKIIEKLQEQLNQQKKLNQIQNHKNSYFTYSNSNEENSSKNINKWFNQNNNNISFSKLQETSILLQSSFQNIRQSIKHISQSKQTEQNKFQLLKQIIQTQQELINKQSNDFQQQNHSLYRFMKTQALQIQQFLKDDKVNKSVSNRFAHSINSNKNQHKNTAILRNQIKPFITQKNSCSIQKSSMMNKENSSFYFKKPIQSSHSKKYITSLYNHENSPTMQHKTKSLLKIQPTFTKDIRQKRKNNQFSIHLY